MKQKASREARVLIRKTFLIICKVFIALFDNNLCIRGAFAFGLKTLYLHEAFKKEDIYLQVMYHVQHDSLRQVLNLKRNALFFGMSFSFLLRGPARIPIFQN